MANPSRFRVPAPTQIETFYHTYAASLSLIFPTLTPSARDVVVKPLEAAQRAVHWCPMRLDAASPKGLRQRPAWGS